MDIFDLFKKIEQPKATMGTVEYLVVGLGNPGKEYANTRHNVGFMAVDQIASKLGVKVDRLKFKSLTGEGVVEGKRVLLMKPSTFMNLSGQAVTEAMAFYKIPLERVLVIYDDVSLDVGRIRLRGKGSAGGHNGIKNIIYLSGKDEFPRIKIGVGGKPHPDYDMADWVLGSFSKEDGAIIQKVCGEMPEVVSVFVKEGIVKAMSQFNG